MPRNGGLTTRAVLLVAFLGIVSAPARVFSAVTQTVLYSFCSENNCADGSYPTGGLILDAAGNLYGTVSRGGAYGYGAVFELVASPKATWTHTFLYSFTGGIDGGFPNGTLTLDAAGNLYGVSQGGGTHGYGTVFQLQPGANGTWTEHVLHSFNLSRTDGRAPNGGLIFDQAGNLYGTTAYGSSARKGCNQYGCGMVFRLTPQAGGGWAETILHSFGDNDLDGYLPYAGLIFDASGNLYGTTEAGGRYQYGTVFELLPQQDGTWKEVFLHQFQNNGVDGILPFSRLIFDAAGNLYGTADAGGTYYSGAIFELVPSPNGRWSERVLHSFDDDGADGTFPQSTLAFDSNGSLYGTTVAGGANNLTCGGYGCGVTFQLTPSANGNWAEKVLYSFCSDSECIDGAVPGDVISGNVHELYGITNIGGANPSSCNGVGCGTVFEITR